MSSLMRSLNQPQVPLPKFSVQSAYQGEEGLGIATAAFNEGKPFCIAFVDMRMPPGWDGIETIKRLWALDPDLQIVICSAYSDYTHSDIKNHLTHMGKLLILKKPFDPIEVAQMAIALSEKWIVERYARVKDNELQRQVDVAERELSNAQVRIEMLEKEIKEYQFIENLESGKVILRPSDPSDFEHASRFKLGLQSVLQDNPETLIIDLGQLDSITSLGIALMIAADKKLPGQKVSLSICNAHNQVKTALRDVACLDQIITFYTLDDALELRA